MSNYPAAIDSFRENENIPQITYQPLQKRTIFAEDLNSMRDAIVAVEETLGTNPQGAAMDVAARLGALATSLAGKQDFITAGTTAQYYRGDKTWQTLNKAAVGLGNVDNTADLNKPISTATKAYVDNGLRYSSTAIATGKKWIDGRTIYTKTINIGALPNAANKYVAHGIVGWDRFVSLSGWVFRSADNVTFSLPFPHLNPTLGVQVWIEGSNIGIGTSFDRSNMSGYVTLEWVE